MHSLKRKFPEGNVLLQVLFNPCMMSASNEVRANLTFKMACRTISSARIKERPTAPLEFQDILDRFDDNDDNPYPEKFKKLYLGKTVMTIKGESCSEGPL